MATLQARRAAFGRFVRRALEDAKSRKITVTEIEKRTGVGSTTFYRWRDGDWSKDPRASQVDAFCEGLDLPISAAYRALGWGREGRIDAPPEPTFEPELRAIQRRLMDPGVSESEKQSIRGMLKLIAQQAGSPSRKAAGQD